MGGKCFCNIVVLVLVVVVTTVPVVMGAQSEFDPYQLNGGLIAAVAGKHPTAKDEAIQLAALQCQIDSGNLNPQNPSDPLSSPS